MTKQDLVLIAIRNRISSFFSSEIDEIGWPSDRAFLKDQVSVGDRRLDSLDLVEILSVVEEELGVSLLDVDDMGDVGTLQAVSLALSDTADPTTVQTFCSRWVMASLS